MGKEMKREIEWNGKGKQNKKGKEMGKGMERETEWNEYGNGMTKKME